MSKSASQQSDLHANEKNMQSAASFAVERLNRFSAVLLGASIVYAVFAVMHPDLERWIFGGCAIACAAVGLFGFRMLQLGKNIVATLTQSALVIILGLGLVPISEFGWLAMISFATLSVIHTLAFIPSVRKRVQKTLELAVAFSTGTLVCGLVLTNAWTRTEPAGIVMALLIMFLLIFEWRTVSKFVSIDHAAPTRRFGDLQNAISRMGTGIAQFSATGEVITASTTVAEMLGAAKYELAGRGFVKRVHILDQPAFLRLISDAAHAKMSGNIEIRVRVDQPNAMSGPPKFVWMELSAANTSSQNSEDSLETLVVVRDVTARKQRQVQIEDAKKSAEQTASIKSRFLATIGHELRTPLNAIVGFSEMMNNGIGGELSDTHAEYAGHIQSSGRHLLDVVNMLLDMSKIEAGKFELQLETFSPAELVAPTLNMLDAQLTKKNVKVRTQIAAQLPDCTADERACRQILINLMSNAIKFSNDNDEISVKMERQGSKLALTVKDRGVGMSAEEASRVGEPFYQAAAGLSRRFEGTGLGLSIVKGLIDLHGGQLLLQSEKGRGTTVTVLLPLNGPTIDQKPTATITAINEKSTHSTATTNVVESTWTDRKTIAS